MRRLMLATLLSPRVLAAQAAGFPLPVPALRAAMDRLPAINAWILDRQAALCRIPAPPFREGARATGSRRELVSLGYANTSARGRSSTSPRLTASARTSQPGGRDPRYTITVSGERAQLRRLRRPESNASSTDANVPISLGIPAVTIDDGGHGDGAHSLREWYDDGVDGWKGPQWALLLVAALAGVRTTVR